MTQVEIYTDGASRGNPGNGGFGSIIRFTDSKGQLHEKEISRGYRDVTNNQMELMGAIAALEALTRPCQVRLFSDSKYLTDAFNKKWINNWSKCNWTRDGKHPVKNAELWQRLLRACENHRVEFNWIKGHDGNDMNERCDKLATRAADELDKGK